MLCAHARFGLPEKMADGSDPLFSLDTVRDFIVSNGGKVSNHELVTHFKHFLNDPRRKGMIKHSCRVEYYCTIGGFVQNQIVVVVRRMFIFMLTSTSSSTSSSTVSNCSSSNTSILICHRVKWIGN